MGKLADLRAALADAVSGIADAQAKPYVWEKPSVTTLSVMPASDTMVEFDRQFGRGSDEWSFQIEALVPTNDWESAQRELDEMLEPYGDRSVKQAVEASTDPLLAKKTHVTGVERYGFRRIGDTLMLGALVNVTVMASGSSS